MRTIILLSLITIYSSDVFAQSNLIIKTRDGNWIDVPVDNFLHLDFAPCGIIDYGGQTYYTIKIGDQCWFAQNLNIGSMIPDHQNQTDNSTIEKYCYSNEPDSCDIHGGLYQWDEAMQYVTTEGTQGICPPGWHIPTLAEYQTLGTEVSGDANSLKEIGQGTGDGAGTNISGFSALLSGYRSSASGFNSIYDVALFWSSTEYSATNAYTLRLFTSVSNIFYFNYDQTYGFSIRCIKD